MGTILIELRSILFLIYCNVLWELYVLINRICIISYILVIRVSFSSWHKIVIIISWACMCLSIPIYCFLTFISFLHSIYTSTHTCICMYRRVYTFHLPIFFLLSPFDFLNLEEKPITVAVVALSVVLPVATTVVMWCVPFFPPLLT